MIPPSIKNQQEQMSSGQNNINGTTTDLERRNQLAALFLGSINASMDSNRNNQ